MENKTTETGHNSAPHAYLGSQFTTLAEAIAALENCATNGVSEGLLVEQVKRYIYDNLPPKTGDDIVKRIIDKGTEAFSSRNADVKSIFSDVSNVLDKHSDDAFLR